VKAAHRSLSADGPCADRAERHHAAVATRIEMIAVIPVRTFCQFWPGLAGWALGLKSLGFSAWLRSGRFAVPTFSGEATLLGNYHLDKARRQG
jgi:hypothetical protein